MKGSDITMRNWFTFQGHIYSTTWTMRSNASRRRRVTPATSCYLSWLTSQSRLISYVRGELMRVEVIHQRLVTQTGTVIFAIAASADLVQVSTRGQTLMFPAFKTRILSDSLPGRNPRTRSASPPALLAIRGSPTPVVDLGYAQYSGTFNETTKTTEFLGIRFAAPPTGTLRWQPPHPPASTPGIQKAETQPPTCFFHGIPEGMSPTSPFRDDTLRKREFHPSEDCLFLNVYLPGQLSQRKRVPVVVWIHGGGYMSGSAQGLTGADVSDGKDLIRESNNGVVVVVIQYRLGLFGFLSGSEVKKNGVLNAGLLDQQFALQWVQKNIQKFNGDPARVAIWGVSAGAGSVLQHVIANGGRTWPPLFRAGITSSTFLPSQYGYSDRIPELLYKEVVSQTNCSSESDTLACLRAVDVSVLDELNSKIAAAGFYGTFAFVPVVDGEFIRERPTEALKKGNVNGEIILATTNTFEGAIFIDPKTPSNVDVKNYVAQLFPTLDAKEIAAAASQYENLGSPTFQVTAIMGEAIFICPTYYLLQAFGGHGYKSEFAIPPGNHGNDAAYYFPNGNVPPFANADFIKAFSESFLDFAMALNPNVKSGGSTITPSWAPWFGVTEMLFNRTEGGLPDIRAIKTSSALLERCSFWESVSASSGHTAIQERSVQSVYVQAEEFFFGAISQPEREKDRKA
ncbi:putative type-B carboxylesterase lipase family protein [Lyophyllum shimeji]|uniref:Type-B carboxylesterase lipase family protein n=1 Tax=Lyophyllum shimeji TaxID=47721 RepID=A0A9P3Q099_LYOSH|nr:putative type-B carboxylesterase lipase family protein [Lyophyllum shimeji]